MIKLFWNVADFEAGRCSREDVGRRIPGVRRPTGAEARAAREARKAERTRKLAEKALVPGKVPEAKVPVVLREHYPTEQAWLDAIKQAEKALATAALQEAHHAALKPGDALQKATRLRRARKLVTEAAAASTLNAPDEAPPRIEFEMVDADGNVVDLSRRWSANFYQRPDGTWGNHNQDALDAARAAAGLPVEDAEPRMLPVQPQAPEPAQKPAQDAPAHWKGADPLLAGKQPPAPPVLLQDELGALDAKMAALRASTQQIEDLL